MAEKFVGGVGCAKIAVNQGSCDTRSGRRWWRSLQEPREARRGSGRESAAMVYEECLPTDGKRSTTVPNTCTFLSIKAAEAEKCVCEKPDSLTVEADNSGERLLGVRSRGFHGAKPSLACNTRSWEGRLVRCVRLWLFSPPSRPPYRNLLEGGRVWSWCYPITH